MILALFDFDGTITHKDSMFDFIKNTVGYRKYLFGLIYNFPMLVAFKIGLLSNTKAKEKLLSSFFFGWLNDDFEVKADKYSLTLLPKIIRKNALTRLEWHKEQGHKIVIVSASARQWLKGWCELNRVELIASELEVHEGRITGKLKSCNCYGEEKVNRIKQRYNLQNVSYIYSYGDTSGDFPMLNLANEKFYKVF
jgi:phosphatidylglycerophosphatase C